MTEQRIPYNPNAVTAPGETLADLLDERCMSQAELAKRMGRPAKTINEIVKGKAAITPETALQLEKVMETPADYWLTHEAHYRAYLARLEENDKLAQYHDWLDTMPVKELKSLGVLPDLPNRGRNKTALLRSLLQFCAVASPEEWQTVYGSMQAAFRQSRRAGSDTNATAVWLRLGEVRATAVACERYDGRKFEEALAEIRKLTVCRPEEFEPAMKALCAAAGVAFVLSPAIPRAHVSGAARWLRHTPVIQLSLYGKTNDRFWFTFFHEAGHILNHSRKLVYLDDWESGDRHQEEAEANRFAARLLIPRQHESELPSLTSKDAVREFAGRLGIHPGIVVGRLQHEALIEQSWMNDLKDTFEWREIR